MKVIATTSFLFFISLHLLYSQSRSFFSIGVMGSLSKGERVTSLAQSFNNKADCLQLNTGLALYSGYFGIREFDLACKSNPSSPAVEIRLYPNPVQNYVRIEGSGFMGNEPQITMVLFDDNGRKVLQEIVTTAQLITGRSYNWGWLSSGNYYLRVDGYNTHRIIPFIKLN